MAMTLFQIPTYAALSSPIYKFPGNVSHLHVKIGKDMHEHSKNLNQ